MEGITLPRRNPLEMSDLNPSQFALKAFSEERRRDKELCEEARRLTTDVGMRPADEATRLDAATVIYVIISDQSRIKEPGELYFPFPYPSTPPLPCHLSLPSSYPLSLPPLSSSPSPSSSPSSLLRSRHP